MKNLRWLLIAVLMATMLLTVAACGGEEPAAEPKPTEAAQVPEDTPVPPTETPVPPTDTPVPPTDTPVPPTDTPAPPTETPIPEPSEEPKPERELDLSGLADPTGFSSYRSMMTVSMVGTSQGEEINASFEMLIEFTSDPPAQHFVISTEGVEDAEELGNIEMYVIEDTMYLQFGGEWMSMPAEGDPLAEMDIFTSQDVLEDTCGWQQQEDTEINGVRVQHWTTTEADLEGCATGDELADLGEMDEFSGDVYIAVEENYLVRMDIVIEGSNMDSMFGEEAGMDQGRLEVSMELLDVNQPFTIELPEEATAGSGLPEDIPTPADAEEVFEMMGMITFMSASTVEEISEFYQVEMPNYGWTESSVEEMAGMYMLEYTKDGRTASLMISEDSDSGKTSVLITIGEE